MLKYIKKLFLYPLHVIYGIIIQARNILYDLRLISTYKFNSPVIIIGNIHVGGTGKTPMVIYLANILHKNFNLAIISRGYKRQTKGMLKVNDNSLAINVGDEALMIKHKLKQVSVYVAEKRVPAIEQLKNKYQLFILDDGFQHRNLSVDLNIILIPYSYIIKNSYFLPYGNQRDAFNSLKRAQIIIITKCPEPTGKPQQNTITNKVKIYNKNLAVYFSSIQYLGFIGINTLSINNTLNIKCIDYSYTVILVTAIANNQEIIKFLQQTKCNIIEYNYKDHYYYQNSDLNEILNRYNRIPGKNKIILTTEKDYTKLKELGYIQRLDDVYCYYLDFEIKINNNKESEFLQFILNYISKYHNNN
ncbi:MAG: tetraacyldisaccharide 4'-kinase [Solitalea-like symbiont of Acarus siro]